jgi:putative transposase
VERVRRVQNVSERRACRALGQPRSTQRYAGVGRERDKMLLLRIKELAREHPRYDNRRITALLRREGWSVNLKRVHRLCRREGLKVPQRQRKRRRLGNGENGCTRRRAERPNHVWSYDFILDQTADGRTLKLLPIVDEFTRECLTIEVERGITAEDVVSTLEYLFEVRGVTDHIRSDDGPEFVAEAVKGWLARRGSGPLYIEPESPWENAYSETFNSRLRDELLDREVFESLKEAKVIVEDHRLEYNHRHPHSSLGYRTPAEFVATCPRPDPASLHPTEARSNPDPVLTEPLEQRTGAGQSYRLSPARNHDHDELRLQRSVGR